MRLTESKGIHELWHPYPCTSTCSMPREECDRARKAPVCAGLPDPHPIEVFLRNSYLDALFLHSEPCKQATCGEVLGGATWQYRYTYSGLALGICQAYRRLSEDSHLQKNTFPDNVQCPHPQFEDAVR
eukprot:2934017-Amphidinium_carterae.1